MTTKLVNAIEKGKADLFAKQSGMIWLYKYTAEKKIRFTDKPLLFVGQSHLIADRIDHLMTLQMREGGEWYISEQSPIATEIIFQEALKEAESLCNDYLCPEIDNLASQTTSSVLYKVLIERDILTEGHIEVPKRTANAWLRKSAAFFAKYRDYAGEEGKIYARF